MTDTAPCTRFDTFEAYVADCRARGVQSLPRTLWEELKHGERPTEITPEILAQLEDGMVLYRGRAELFISDVDTPTGLERRFVMRGLTGTHTLLVTATDLERLNAHWRRFAEHPENAPRA